MGCGRWDSNPHWRVFETRSSAVGIRPQKDDRAYPGAMRRLIFVVVVVVAVRALLAYREQKLSTGEVELGLDD